jgi:hypothetical protein
MIPTGSSSQVVSSLQQRSGHRPPPAVLGFLRLISIVTQVEISFHPSLPLSIENYTSRTFVRTRR